MDMDSGVGMDCGSGVGGKLGGAGQWGKIGITNGINKN